MMARAFLSPTRFSFFAALLLAGCSSSSSSENKPGASGGSTGAGGRAGGTGSASGVGGTGSSTGGMNPQGTGGMSAPQTPNWSVSRVTTWENDATAAYTIFHDDTCQLDLDNIFDLADPELTERGLVASFGAIAEPCRSLDFWDELEVLRSHGHEIANHSFSHPVLTMRGADIALEIDGARDMFEDNLTDYVATFFIFPQDRSNQTLVDHLRSQNYLGARTGDRDVDSANFDPFEINFDVWGPGYSIYNDDRGNAGGTPCAGVPALAPIDLSTAACGDYLLEQYVKDIISAGGYGIREFHSLNGEGWEPIALDVYEKHLDFVKDRVDAGELWVATASEAVRYRVARNECPLPTVSGDMLLFATASDRCSRHATELSYVVSTLDGNPPANAPTATQGAATLEVTDNGDGTFFVNADPTAGNVVLSVN